MLGKLSVRNAKRQAKDYIIYFITVIISVALMFSFNSIGTSKDISELSYILDSDFNISNRSGLHCSPLAHKTIGTYPNGTIRFSIGYFNTMEEIKYVIDSLNKINKLY